MPQCDLQCPNPFPGSDFPRAGPWRRATLEALPWPVPGVQSRRQVLAAFLFREPQAKCKKIINDAYFCARSPDLSSKPKTELPRPLARAFAEQVGLVGEFSKQSTFYLKEASQLIDRTRHRLAGLQHTLEKADKAGLVGRRLPLLQKMAANAASEAAEANSAAAGAKRLCDKAIKNASSGPLKEAEEQGKDLVTEPLMASLEAVRGPRAIVTPWSRHAAHPPGLYCQKVCENRPEPDEHFLS
ncbi:unnamed protein product [Symbiodinium natans]|uniref:Uncharacterized protein n=1 Tax=Symbiodinium natans TaxID=878477 RepID=A0A812GU15_9DINO|nr:unnamed protein product [Symbiodinium natans]